MIKRDLRTLRSVIYAVSRLSEQWKHCTDLKREEDVFCHFGHCCSSCSIWCRWQNTEVTIQPRFFFVFFLQQIKKYFMFLQKSRRENVQYAILYDGATYHLKTNSSEQCCTNKYSYKFYFYGLLKHVTILKECLVFFELFKRAQGQRLRRIEDQPL